MKKTIKNKCWCTGLRVGKAAGVFFTMVLLALGLCACGAATGDREALTNVSQAITTQSIAEAPNATVTPVDQSTARPLLFEIQPLSGPAGISYPIEATIMGRGFTASNNSVSFGPVILSNLPSSAEGTKITFAVPKFLQTQSEVQPLVLPPGEYEVRAENSAGLTNAIIFVMTQNP